MKRAFLGIYSQTLRPKDMVYLDKILSLIDKLIKTVGIWHLECNTDIEAADVSYLAMSTNQ